MPIHASAAASRNAFRESALSTPTGLDTRPSEKQLLGPSSHFFELWEAGFEFPGNLGIPRKSWENHPRANSENRAPDTNRRCGRLRMDSVLISEPPAVARRRIGVAEQGKLNFPGFPGNPGNPGKMSLPGTSDPDEENYFPKISIGQRV